MITRKELSFPAFGINVCLAKDLPQQGGANIFLMRIGNPYFQGFFFHKSVLPAAKGTIKSQKFEFPYQFTAGCGVKHGWLLECLRFFHEWKASFLYLEALVRSILLELPGVLPCIFPRFSHWPRHQGSREFRRNRFYPQVFCNARSTWLFECRVTRS